MKAFRITSHTAAAHLDEIATPSPAPGEIRLKIAACGLNFADLLMQKGTYQNTPALPFTGGLELAGTVDAVGAEVTGFAPGDRVAVNSGQGGLAEFGCFDARRAVYL